MTKQALLKCTAKFCPHNKSGDRATGRDKCLGCYWAYSRKSVRHPWKQYLREPLISVAERERLEQEAQA